MQSSPNSRGRYWLRGFALAVCLVPAPLITLADAQDEAPPTTVQLTLAGYTLAPEMTGDGVPLLDEDGLPVILRVALDESVVTPGDEVLYVITLDNPTEEPAMNLSLDAQVAPEVLLDPFSLFGPEGLHIEWADAETPDLFRPVFEEIDGEQVMTADLETLRTLRLTLPELPPQEQTSIEYTVTLR